VARAFNFISYYSVTLIKVILAQHYLLFYLDRSLISPGIVKTNHHKRGECMFENIFWATAAAIVTGMAINAFTAGFLSLHTRQQWSPLWLQLTGTQILVTLVSLITIMTLPGLIASLVAIFFSILTVGLMPVFRSRPLIMMAGGLVATASFLIGQSAATGDIVGTEKLVFLGGLGAVVIGIVWGVLHLVFRKRQER
jgi:hypothetical protein